MGDVLRIVTSLDPDECERRLQARLDEDSAGAPRRFPFELPTRTALRAVAVLRALSGSTPDDASVEVTVEGRVARDKSMFWVSRQVEGGPFVDSFAPRLYAKSLSTGGGTELRIELRMARFVRAFLAVWVAAVIVLG